MPTAGTPVAILQELDRPVDLGIEVADPDLGAEADLLEFDRSRATLGFLIPLGQLVLVLAVVEEPDDGRSGHRRDLDEVEIESSGHAQCVGNRLDPELVTVRTDEADLAGPDAVVDPVLLALVALRRGYGCSLLCNG